MACEITIDNLTDFDKEATIHIEADNFSSKYYQCSIEANEIKTFVLPYENHPAIDDSNYENRDSITPNMSIRVHFSGADGKICQTASLNEIKGEFIKTIDAEGSKSLLCSPGDITIITDGNLNQHIDIVALAVIPEFSFDEIYDRIPGEVIQLD